MHDDQSRMVDEEIDAVARSLTAASPSAALRSGVRARMEGRSGGSHPVRWSLGIAAGAAGIVLAIVWPGREPPVDTAASLAVASVPPPEAVQPTEQAAATESVVGRTLSGSPGKPDPPSPDGFGAARPTQEALLPTEPTAITEPLVIEPLELDPLGVEEIEFPTLTVEAMTVAPLSQQ